MTKVFSHEHLITLEHLADRIIPILSKLLFRRPMSLKILKRLLRIANPFSDEDDLERIANFLSNTNKTQAENWFELKQWMSKGDEACVLTICQDHMGRGEVPIPYRQQVREVCDLIDKGEPIRLFLHLDPRMPNMMGNFWEFQSYISGIKMYPYMGHFPYDINLNPLWRRCEKFGYPVIWHCSPTNINWYGGKDIDKILKKSLFPLIHTKNNNKHKSTNFSNPLGIIKVAKSTPNINHIIAHLGGKEEVEKWVDGKDSFTKTIIEACIDLPNVYVDTSFTVHNEKMFDAVLQILKIVPEHKIIWGTDFYMNKSVADMKNYVIDFRNYIGDDKFNRISSNMSKLINLK